MANFARILFHRIYVFPLVLPPLRGDGEDIPPWLSILPNRFVRKNGWKPIPFTSEVIGALREYCVAGQCSWVRNVVEADLFCLSSTGEVDFETPCQIGLAAEERLCLRRILIRGALSDRVQSFERDVLLAELKRANYNVAAAARALHLERSHLYKKARATPGVDLRAVRKDQRVVELCPLHPDQFTRHTLAPENASSCRRTMAPLPCSPLSHLPPPTYRWFRMVSAWIPMKDGIRLAATLYMPDGANPGEKFPALLDYLPYRKDDGTAAGDYPKNAYFCRRGYVGARVDIRGFGASEGRPRTVSIPEHEQMEWRASHSLAGHAAMVERQQSGMTASVGWIQCVADGDAKSGGAESRHRASTRPKGLFPR